MTEPKEICTVYLGSPTVDNDYTLYEDGRIKRFYDQNQWSLNNVVWLDVSHISDDIKQALLAECPEESKEQAKKILGL